MSWGHSKQYTLLTIEAVQKFQQATLKVSR